MQCANNFKYKKKNLKFLLLRIKYFYIYLGYISTLGTSVIHFLNDNFNSDYIKFTCNIIFRVSDFASTKLDYF